MLFMLRIRTANFEINRSYGNIAATGKQREKRPAPNAHNSRYGGYFKTHFTFNHNMWLCDALLVLVSTVLEIPPKPLADRFHRLSSSC